MSSTRNELPKAEELRKELNSAVTTNFRNEVLVPTHAQLNAILKEGDMRDQSNKLLIKDAATRTVFEHKLRDVIANDADSENANTTGMTLIELLEVYVYSHKLQRRVMTSMEIEDYIAKRLMDMSAVIGIPYAKILRQVTRYRAYKTAIRSNMIFNNVGLNASQFNSFDFENPSHAEIVKNTMKFNEIQKLHTASAFSAISDEIQANVGTALAPALVAGATPATIMSAKKNAVKKIKENLDTLTREAKAARDQIQNTLQNQMSLGDRATIVPETLKSMGEELDKYNKQLTTLEKLGEQIDNPTLTLQNYSSVLTNSTDEEKDVFFKRISGTIKDYVEKTTDEYIQRMEDKSVQLQRAKEKEVRKVKTSYGDIFQDWPHLKNVYEVENSLNNLMGNQDNSKEEWIKLTPGAWFEFAGKDGKGKDVTFFDEIESINKRDVTFKRTGKKMDLKVLLGYILHAKYPSPETSDLKVTYIHDANKNPLNTVKDLEKRMGYRSENDNSSAPKIARGNFLVSFNKATQHSEAQDEILSVTPSTKTITLKSMGPISFDEFLLYARKNNWTIQDGSKLDTIDSKVRPNAGGVGFVSILSFGKAIAKRFEKWSKNRKEKRERDLLISMVYQFPIGSKFWKDAVKDLSGKESGEVDSKIEELKGKYTTDGERGSAIRDFLEKKINITDFDQRVEAKAMLQWTLSTYGTLYPNTILKDAEKKRRWLEIFAESHEQLAEAREESKKKNDPVNGVTEYNQLFALLNKGSYQDRVLAGSFGNSYANKIDGLKVDGAKSSEDGKNKQMSAALDINKIMDVVRDTIKNQQWGALKAVFEKLATKNYPIAAMSNLFIYTFDQIHYKDGLHHRSKIPFQDLQGMAKSLSGQYNLPFFSLIQKPENFQLGCDLLYENKYILDYWDPNGKWQNVDSGIPIPPGPKGADLYKALNIRDGHMVLLKGFSQDKADTPVETKADMDLRKYRNMVYGGNMPNVQYNVVTKDVEKTNWAKNPLYTALNGHSFSSIVSFSRGAKGWSKEEAEPYMEALMTEMKQLNRSALPEEDKQYVRARLSSVLYEELLNDDSWWNEPGYVENNDELGKRQPKPNRDFFIDNYGKRFYDLGITYELGKHTSNPDDKNDEQIIWTDHFPINPKNTFREERYKSKVGAGLQSVIDYTARRASTVLRGEQADQSMNIAA